MEEYLKELDENLVFIKKVKKDNVLLIYCESKQHHKLKVHTRHERKVKDIPYGEHQVELRIISKRYFNDDLESEIQTITEKFDFINETGRRTKRLDDKIIELNTGTSVIGNERFLRKNYANISDTSILRILKKRALR